LVLPESFQRKVVTQKPNYGRSWSIFDFEIPLGEPASKALVSDLRSRVPQARVGNIEDGNPATIRLAPSDISIEFGVDDGTAIAWTSLSPFGLGSDIVVGAKATVTAKLSIDGKPPRTLRVVGTGALQMSYISIRESDVGKAIGLAIDDAAKQLGDIVEADARGRVAAQ